MYKEERQSTTEFKPTLTRQGKNVCPLSRLRFLVRIMLLLLLLDPFSSRERPRSSKKGRRNLTSMCLPFRLQLAFSLAQGKCIASLQEEPAAPLQCKGLNLTSASVKGNWTASFADRLLLIYRWTPFPAVSGRDPRKRGAAT